MSWRWREGVLLASGRFVDEVESVDDRQPQSVEGRHQRQEHRIGVRRREAHGQVGGQNQRDQPSAVPQDVGGHLALNTQAHRGVSADTDGKRQDQEEQLGTAALPVHESQEGARRTCLWGGGHGLLLGETVGDGDAVAEGELVGSVAGSVMGVCCWARSSTVRRASSRSLAAMPARTVAASKSASRSVATSVVS